MHKLKERERQLQAEMEFMERVKKSPLKII